MALSRMALGSTPGRCFFFCSRRRASSSGVVVVRWLGIVPPKGRPVYTREEDLTSSFFFLNSGFRVQKKIELRNQKQDFAGYRVIQTSFENVFRRASATFASVSEGNFTRTRKTLPLL